MTDSREIVIIKRKRDTGDDGHHGGVWKVAFADFMTAMMAFFLVLWIVNSTSKETRSSIARYFNPIRLSDTTPARKGLHEPKETDFDASGSKSAVNLVDAHHAKSLGQSSKPGAYISPEYPERSDQENTPEESTTVSSARRVTTHGQREGRSVIDSVEQQRDPQASQSSPSERNLVPIARSNQKSKSIEAQIEEDRTRIQSSISKLIQNRTSNSDKAKYPTVHTERVTEGILISVGDIIDGEMFRRGSVTLNRRSLEVIEKIALGISDQVKGIIISGYTDSLQIRNDPFGNWRLSALRAEAAMRVLIGAGLQTSKFERIEGYADRKPKIDLSTDAPENRRIQIFLRYTEK